MLARPQSRVYKFQMSSRLAKAVQKAHMRAGELASVQCMCIQAAQVRFQLVRMLVTADRGVHQASAVGPEANLGA